MHEHSSLFCRTHLRCSAPGLALPLTWEHLSPLFTPSPSPQGFSLVSSQMSGSSFPPDSALILTTYSSFARLNKRVTVLWIWTSEFLSSYFSLSLSPFPVKFLGNSLHLSLLLPPWVPPTAPSETALAEVSKTLLLSKSIETRLFSLSPMAMNRHPYILTA